MDVYEAEEADEVGLRRGEEVEVMQKSIDGWWTVKLASGKVGLAPATFLKKMEDKFSSTVSNRTEQLRWDHQIRDALSCACILFQVHS